MYACAIYVCSEHRSFGVVVISMREGNKALAQLNFMLSGSLTLFSLTKQTIGVLPSLRLSLSSLQSAFCLYLCFCQTFQSLLGDY